MGKQNKGKKAEKGLGKGKVTPIQIAFILDRYLADNNYVNTLSAFRSEADDLLSRIKGKEAPKGLLGLVEILDEYISLKEQRVAVENDKQRVEMALRGIQEVARAYDCFGNGTLPQSPPLVPTRVNDGVLRQSSPPLVVARNPSNSLHHLVAGRTILGTSTVNCTQPPLLPFKVVEPSKKRRASSSAPKVPPAPKKPCTQPAKGSSIAKGKTSLSQETRIINAEESINNPKGTSVSKSLFTQSRASSSSPKTPQPFLSQADITVSPPSEDSSLRTASIISSETIIVSPLKRAGYYSIERSYRVMSSPYKSSPKKLGKREHVKGRLLFDEPDASMTFKDPNATESSTPSTDVETPENFDFDFPDLDIFNGDFSFTDLLEDFNPSCEGSPDAPADSIQGS